MTVKVSADPMDWNVGEDAYIRPRVDVGIDSYAIPLKLTKMCKQSIIKLLLPIAEFGQRAFSPEAVEKARHQRHQVAPWQRKNCRKERFGCIGPKKGASLLPAIGLILRKK